MPNMRDFFFDKQHQSCGPVMCQDMVHYDDSSTYDYYCDAYPKTTLAEPYWWVVRVTKANSNVCHALDPVQGTMPGWLNVATDLATVAALIYRT